MRIFVTSPLKRVWQHLSGTFLGAIHNPNNYNPNRYKIPKRGPGRLTESPIDRIILKIKYSLICMKNIFKEIETFQFLKNFG